MVWVKLDDGFFRNRKARLAGKDGRALFLAGLCYCGATLTDGHIATVDLSVIAAEADVKPAVANTLVKVGLWEKVDDGWLVHDYTHYNRLAADVKKDRDEGRERAARSRERARNADGTFGDGNSERPTDPSSSSSRPFGDSSVSGSSSSNYRIGEEDDWPTIIAKRRLERREREKGRVTNPQQWLTKTIGSVRDEFMPPDGWPTMTATEIADILEPHDSAPRNETRAEQIARVLQAVPGEAS